jgi:protein gp37
MNHNAAELWLFNPAEYDERAEIMRIEKTWNPVTGCSKISAGCAHCYAERMARRWAEMGLPKYKNGFAVTLHENIVRQPLQWRKAHSIFICSMSDVFHNDVPFDFVDKIIQTIVLTPQHQYQMLTKRAERMAEYFSTRSVPSNVCLGVTVEALSSKYRINILRGIAAARRFLCCTPLLEDLGELNLTHIDRIFAGKESGENARPMKNEWALAIEKQAQEQGSIFLRKGAILRA